MKILPINLKHITFNTNFNSSKNNDTELVSSFSMPFDSISFSGSTGIDGNRMRKNFVGMNCPCCGIKMLSRQDEENILSKANLPFSQILPFMEKYRESFHPIQKQVFDELSSLSIRYPEKTVRELLQLLRTRALEHLHQDEKIIISRIRNMGNFLPHREQLHLEAVLNDAEQLILNNDEDSTFRRRAFIARVADGIKGISKSDIAETIFKVAHELPKSDNNENAFIVKYTEKKSKSRLQQTSADIIHGIISPSVGTVEHVKARSSIDQNGGGENKMKNYLLICSRCNNLRACTPFKKFVRDYPNFYRQQVIDYLDKITERINSGELKGFEEYPLQITRTLRRQSKGKIKLKAPIIHPPSNNTDSNNKKQ